MLHTDEAKLVHVHPTRNGAGRESFWGARARCPRGAPPPPPCARQQRLAGQHPSRAHCCSPALPVRTRSCTAAGNGGPPQDAGCCGRCARARCDQEPPPGGSARRTRSSLRPDPGKGIRNRPAHRNERNALVSLGQRHPAMRGFRVTGGGGGYVVDGRDNAWRSRAPGPHAHGNAATQVVDGLRPEVWGQRKQSNDPCNSQRNPRYASYWAPLTRTRHIRPSGCGIWRSGVGGGGGGAASQLPAVFDLWSAAAAGKGSWRGGGGAGLDFWCAMGCGAVESGPGCKAPWVG